MAASRQHRMGNDFRAGMLHLEQEFKKDLREVKFMLQELSKVRSQLDDRFRRLEGVLTGRQLGTPRCFSRQHSPNRRGSANVGRQTSTPTSEKSNEARLKAYSNQASDGEKAGDPLNATILEGQTIRPHAQVACDAEKLKSPRLMTPHCAQPDGDSLLPCSSAQDDNAGERLVAVTDTSEKISCTDLVICPEPESYNLALQAVITGDIEQLRQLLLQGVDANFQFENITLHNKKLTHCSLLAAAVSVRHPTTADILELLVAENADPDSTYGFLAGSRRMQWSGSASFAPVAKGDMDMLQTLIFLAADPHVLATNGANLVWQATYSGHKAMVAYLLEIKVSCEIAAASQDKTGVTYTPLHVAIVSGQGSCVKPLIVANASVNYKNEEGRSPLDDAIHYCLPPVVCWLVTAGADLVNEVKFGKISGMETRALTVLMDDSPHRSSDSPHHWSTRCSRSLQAVFDTKNHVIVCASARGLQCQPEQVKCLSRDEVAMFLSSPGRTRIEILRALFCLRKLRYRNSTQGIHELKTAKLGQDFDGNESNELFFPHVVQTKHSFANLEELVKARKEPDAELLDFIHALCPQEHFGNCCLPRSRQTTITIHECLVEEVEHDLRVLTLLAECPMFDDIWLEMPCQAIFRGASKPRRFHLLMKAELACHAIFLCGLLALSLLCMEKQRGIEIFGRSVSETVVIAAMLGIPVWMFQFCYVTFELYGYSVGGLRIKDVFSDIHVLGIAFVFCDACILLHFCTWTRKRHEGLVFRVWFAICCFFKWTKVLYCCTPWRRCGFPVLPFLVSIHDIGHFLAILVTYLAGLGHAFVATDFLHKHASFTFLRALYFGMIGDPATTLNKFYRPIPPKLDFNEFLTSCVVIFTLFAVPITLMNIFIAALATSYARCTDHNEQIYQHRLAQSVRVRSAILLGVSHACCRRRTIEHERKKPTPRLWYCDNKSFSIE